MDVKLFFKEELENLLISDEMTALKSILKKQ
jgi:hypothetical protein